MEKSPDLSKKAYCFNCGTPIQGTFCHHCGQRVRDNLDRSLGRLMGEFFGNIFFLDNRFLISLWYLVRFPGRMTVEFLEGKRKKFVSPVTLYLFFNLIFFIVNPLTDYSIGLYDQLYYQPYSPMIKDWADNQMKEKGVTEQTYSVTYQNASDNISKSIMIINIPMIALFVYLVAFKRRKYYFDSLIFAFHFFSFFMFNWIMLRGTGELLFFFTGDRDATIADVVFALFTFVFPVLYVMFGIKKFMDIRWYWAAAAGIAVTLSVLLVNLFYRIIVLFVTFWAT